MNAINNEIVTSYLNSMSDEKPSKFIISPYPDHVEQERMHIFISKTDTDFIRCLRPYPGTLTAVGAYLWHAFCIRCRELGIIDFTSTKQFEQLIQNVVVISKEEYEQLRIQSANTSLDRILPDRVSATAEDPNRPGRTPLRPVPHADGPNAGGGPASVRPAHSNRKTKRSDVQGPGVGKEGEGR